ncbi:nucleolar protein 16 [Suhomyces tanzawaensis NRRL Y-17324]|uniref:Nucleolar protein 16 n=1 Tax=Suhomyces tanzawaensis NRRL Y-17324 TaxID=984487 RepID=A0A1E4SS66_9ASCO|nr:nucleolar protein 16 [Suhomyces tanzawaensis NRRL Y-17324]ODV82356.1 nucleolar protein 16 [Suhomyces tanzawaensis NRRL Y-17324]
MTSVRKRKMARSSVKKNTRRLKDKQRNINIATNPIIQANWDKSLTLQQNYKRLGLRAKLGSLAGGAEKPVETLTEIRAKRAADQKVSVADIENTEDPAQIPEGEARIIRDKETGEVTKVIYGTMKVVPTEELENEPENPSVIRQLEEYSNKHAQIVKERTISEREAEWCKSLYEKHGDDFQKMMWDKKLNPNQQTVADIRRRVLKWKKTNGI